MIRSPHQPSSAAQALREARALGLARIDAQILLLHALGHATDDRAWLIAHDADPLPAAALDDFASLCQRRLAGVPAAYLIGHKEFFGLILAVDDRVLDPRPDTETLVDWALALSGLPVDAQVVDLGTGSGAIALALKAARPGWQVTAVDVSPAALDVAQGNADRLSLGVTFGESHWLQALAQPFHLIVSNPPYVAATDPHLPSLRHEPLQALVSGVDGLDDIRAIVAQAPARLLPGGWLLLEHGHDQAPAVCSLLTAAGFHEVSSRNDLAGIARCSGGQWPERG